MFRPLLFIGTLCLFGIAVQARPKRQCIGKAADIMFVLDSSSSIWRVDYNKQLRFVADLVDSFDVGSGKSQVRIGAITFSDQAYLEFPLDRYTDPVQLKEAILNITHREGRTFTNKALRLLKEQVEPHLTESKGPIVAVVITDGRSAQPADTKAEAEKLHQLGIHVYAIGVGNSKNYDIEELKAIASDPDNGVYTISSYSALKEITQKFHIQPCGEETITPSVAADPTTRATTEATTTPTKDLVEKPVKTEPDHPGRTPPSIILFGYDLVGMGAYRSGMIHQFIKSILPYTGYGHFGIVSYGYCPSSFNVPITSLMDKNPSIIKDSVVTDGKLPDLVDVVRKMRHVLSTRSAQNGISGHIENQAAVLFVDPSVTTITPELTKEIKMLKKNGVQLYLVNVGRCAWPQADRLYSMSSQPYHKYMFNSPSYHQLLLQAQHNPLHFRSIYNKSIPNRFIS
ncbi:unnamed protein product [Acanthosepion pharaonis]|uniref:VWFA domain-containing protein n=1 Tax=Acanthosepion pharaonis TaxID=158019 RepID=A0A812DFJ0_ACAPH|nr:unnamed protein product [Sepia pharaonis]